MTERNFSVVRFPVELGTACEQLTEAEELAAQESMDDYAAYAVMDGNDTIIALYWNGQRFIPEAK